MAAGIVQSNSGANNAPGSATQTASLLGAATAGNVLVASIGSDDYFLGPTTPRTPTPPSGWTLSTGCFQETFLGHYLIWKVAAGGETGATYTLGSAAPSCWIIAEFSGLDAAPYDVSAGQLAQSSGTTYTTPTFTPTAGDRFLIGTIGGSLTGAMSGMSAWTNSFTELQDVWTTLASGTRDNIGLATLAVTANGSTGYSTGATYGVTPVARTGIILAFKVASGSTAKPVADTASAAETFAVAAAEAVADAATAVDVLSASVAASLADAGSAAESLAVTQPVAGADSATAADSLTAAASAAVADAGAGADTLTVTAAVPFADAGSATDAVLLGTPKALADTGTGAEALAVAASVAVAEAGSGADALGLGAPVALADLAAAADALAVSTLAALADTATASDALTVSVASNLLDSAAAADGLSLPRNPDLTDAGSAVDALFVVGGVSRGVMGPVDRTGPTALAGSRTGPDTHPADRPAPAMATRHRSGATMGGT